MVIDIENLNSLVKSGDTSSIYAQLNHINSLELSDKFKALLLILDECPSINFFREYMDQTNSFRKEFEAIKRINRKFAGTTPYPNNDDFVKELLLEYKENNYSIF
jgi:hypothetical protein